MMWSAIKHRLLEGVYKYVPTTLPFASWKRDKWKRPLDKELRSMIRQKKVSYGDGMSEARTIQFTYSIKK